MLDARLRHAVVRGAGRRMDLVITHAHRAAILQFTDAVQVLGAVVIARPWPSKTHGTSALAGSDPAHIATSHY